VRALIVADQLRRPVPGGIGTYVRGLAQGLAQLGDESPDITLWASRPGVADEDAVAELGPVVSSRLASTALVWAWDHGLMAPPAGYDVVHATSLAVPPRASAPMAAMIHDLAWRQFPDSYPRRGRRWHEAALGRAMERAAVLMVPSQVTADALVGAGAPASRVVIVEEGADHLPPADRAAAAKLLSRLGVTGEFLLTVSTLEPRKNLHRLLEAYRVARPRLPEPWPLVVCGPVGWGPRLPAVAGVVLAGAAPGATLAALYAQSRLVAYVPVLEGFGLPVVEAMSACTPVVASVVPSAGGAAREVDPDDTGAIADALVEVATDDRVRSALVTAGLLRAGELTWAGAARRHVELWEKLG
jgi:glycosyltransferase involved in cell wall biosynthesis